MSDKNPYKKGGMFEGASFLLFEKAKHLRKKLTGAEEILWMHLRKGISGYKFRRQHPIATYIADFFCYKLKLIVEVDGSIHNNSKTISNDITRQNDLEKLGYTVIRFTNVEIFEQVDAVLNKISESVNNIVNKAPESESKSPL
jgi:imidazole glycerol-phosphate synthase subunit HisF